MIQINCNNCKALLQIDDAFAGGVCRCRYCGTIQTVPKHLKQAANGEQATVAATAGKSGSTKTSRTLYRKKTGPRGEPLPGSGSGLDELANIVASSGLASARLTKAPGQPEPAPVAPRGVDRKTLMIVGGAGAVIVLLLGIIIAMAMGDKGQPVPGTGNGGNNSSTPEVKSGPGFLGQKLDFNTVVFVLDRGQGTLEEGRLELMKGAVVRALESFGEERLFQVIFWDQDGQVWSFPKDAVAPASKANIDTLRSQMQNVYGRGQTKVEKAIKKAFESKPDAVVVIPVKAVLDDNFDKTVKGARGNSGAKVYTFSLGQENLESELKQVAEATGGKYRNVTPTELREAAGR